MKFWDASAVVPLLHDAGNVDVLWSVLERDAEMLVWWGTPVEVVSALARREREGHLTSTDITAIEGILLQLAAGWQEILPSDALRRTAQRLLRVHPLRAADSLQLAAAVIATDHQPGVLEFVSLDQRLNDAARREGFIVVSPTEK